MAILLDALNRDARSRCHHRDEYEGCAVDIRGEKGSMSCPVRSVMQTSSPLLDECAEAH